MSATTREERMQLIAAALAREPPADESSPHGTFGHSASRETSAVSGVSTDSSQNRSTLVDPKAGTTGAVIGRPPPSAASAGQDGALRPETRWQYGCLRLYLKDDCNKKGCSFLHDLTKKEVALLLAASKRDCHVIFGSSQEDSVPESASSQETETRAPFQAPASQHAAERLGQQESANWVKHTLGTCKPCFFFVLPEGCTDGPDCRFCHFHHERMPQRIKLRPCKGKRERYRKFMDRVAMEVKENPDAFDVNALVVPQSVARNAVVKRMFLQRVVQHVEQVKESLRRGLDLPAAPDVEGFDDDTQSESASLHFSMTRDVNREGQARGASSRDRWMPSNVVSL